MPRPDTARALVLPSLLPLAVGDLVSNLDPLSLKHDLFPMDHGCTMVDVLCRIGPASQLIHAGFKAGTPWLVLGPWPMGADAGVLLLAPDGRVFLEFDGDGRWALASRLDHAVSPRAA